MEKTYNPFKMLGSWTGFILGILTISSAYIANHVVFLHPFAWAYFFGVQMDSEGVGILAILTMPILFFIYGWIIHSVLRKVGRENPVVVIILVSMLVASPVVYGIISDRTAVHTAYSDINSAELLPGGKINTNQESAAVDGISKIVAGESSTRIIVDKMLLIASDESLVINARLEAFRVAISYADPYGTINQKEKIIKQLAILDEQVNRSNQISKDEKEALSSRVSELKISADHIRTL